MYLIFLKILLFAIIQTIPGYSLNNYGYKNYDYELLSANSTNYGVDFLCEEECSDDEVNYPIYYTYKRVTTNKSNFKSEITNYNAVFSRFTLLNIYLDIPPPYNC